MKELKRGIYFEKQKYIFKPIPKYEDVINLLPKPIIDNPDLMEMYSYTLKCAFKNAKVPEIGSNLISNFQDSAFNMNLFLWDSCFISRFLNYYIEYLPGIITLDNFYHMQLPNGLIPREFSKLTGSDYPKWINVEQTKLHSYFHNIYQYRGIDKALQNKEYYYPNLQRTPDEIPYYTLDNLNHPLLAYAEYYHYLHTGNKARLLLVHEALYQYYQSLRMHIRHDIDLYVTDWASMDNSPRNKNLLIGVDISSEMVLFGKMLVEIYKIINVNVSLERINTLQKDIEMTSNQINRYMWDNETGFYYDLDQNLKQIKIKTIAGFWPLIAEIANTNQIESLIRCLENPDTFNRNHRVPSLAADEIGFHSNGGYWAGGVWSPTNLMITDGLEVNGHHKLAKKIAINHLENVLAVYKETHSIWESYPADFRGKGDSDRGDFVGWTGIAPILYLIQYYIGLKADAKSQTLIWEIDSSNSKLGCVNFSFLNKKADFLAFIDNEKVNIKIKTNDIFNLNIIFNDVTHFFQIKGDISLDILVKKND
jgi:glycogen debranching enzyme